jgi:hypothetical protein
LQSTKDEGALQLLEQDGECIVADPPTCPSTIYLGAATCNEKRDVTLKEEQKGVEEVKMEEEEEDVDEEEVEEEAFDGVGDGGALKGAQPSSSWGEEEGDADFWGVVGGNSDNDGAPGAPVSSRTEKSREISGGWGENDRCDADFWGDGEKDNAASANCGTAQREASIGDKGHVCSSSKGGAQFWEEGETDNSSFAECGNTKAQKSVGDQGPACHTSSERTDQKIDNEMQTCETVSKEKATCLSNKGDAENHLYEQAIVVDRDDARCRSVRREHSVTSKTLTSEGWERSEVSVSKRDKTSSCNDDEPNAQITIRSDGMLENANSVLDSNCESSCSEIRKQASDNSSNGENANPVLDTNCESSGSEIHKKVRDNSSNKIVSTSVQQSHENMNAEDAEPVPVLSSTSQSSSQVSTSLKPSLPCSAFCQDDDELAYADEGGRLFVVADSDEDEARDDGKVCRLQRRWRPVLKVDPFPVKENLMLGNEEVGLLSLID